MRLVQPTNKTLRQDKKIKEKIFNWWLARENVHSVASAGEREVGCKRGKTCTPLQARENVQSVLSAGKFATGSKREKTFKWCQAQVNVQRR